MKIAVRFPGVQAEDPRVTVTLEELGTPWPIRVHFLHLQDDETGEREHVQVGFELGERFEVERGTGTAKLETDPTPLDPVAVKRIASNYATYVELARQAIILEQEGITGALRRLRPGRKAARLTDDFYRLVAADYQARREGTTAPLKELAAAHHVDVSTASRWVKEARRRGHVASADE